MNTKLHPHVFREYDIRGTVDTELSEEFAYLLGRAYATMAKKNGRNRIAIGHDCRLSSPAYAIALGRGICDEGLDVFHTGMGPTPQLYYAVFTDGYGGGIQVTGSHNPPDMNGFKICLGTQTLSGTQIQELKTLCEELNGTAPSAAGVGKSTENLIRERYTQDLISRTLPHLGKRKLKVVCDAGNGVGGLVGPALLKGLGVETIELFCDADGTFPNHHPDPSVPKNLAQLIERVRATKADFGIAWDGDADRIGLVDEKGGIVFGDMLVLIFARQVLLEEPGATIIGDVKCSSLLFSDVAAKGGKPIMWKTGHSLIKNKLRETNAALGGEMSGHIFFKQRYFGFDDALYSTARMVEIMSSYAGSCSSLLADLPKTVSTPEIRVDCDEAIKFKLAAMAPELFKEFPVDTTDGARISFEHGWGLVRASNTQPVLVLRFEALSANQLEQYQTLVTSRLDAAKKTLSA
jgi:phosphomannomutase/phosphoglucomutase